MFVVGASRSGTALLRSALNRSSGIFLAGETHYFDDLRPRLGPGARERLDEDDRRLCEDYFLALSHRPYGHGGDPDRARLDRSVLREDASRAGGSGDAYFEAYCRLAPLLEQQPRPAVTSRWGEKTPRHVFRLGDILRAYPDAQAVAMYRDPRGVAASYSRWKHQGGLRTDGDTGYDEALQREEERAQASYDPSVVSLLWRATVRAGAAAQREFGPERVKLVRYEDLVRDPAGTLADVMTWLDEAFEPTMLDVPMHNSSFAQFSQGSGVSSEPVERWRTTLPPRDAAVVQMWAGRDLARLGYAVDPSQATPLLRARAVGTVPLAAARAVWVNRNRAGHLPAYVWRRLRLMRAG